jgi:hypothetical protein
MEDPRRLRDLVSVGPAAEEDLALLGITTVDGLRGRDARVLYERLCRATGVRQDPCCEDVFAAAVAQAEDPALPEERRRWWWWSRVRKARRGG